MGTARTAWKLAGEPVVPDTLTETEEQTLSSLFYDFQTKARPKNDKSIRASTMRSRETAVRFSAGYFVRQCSPQYDRGEIVNALFWAVGIPCADSELTVSLLMGAALWTLDYVREQNLQAELLPLLPETYDSALVDAIPQAEDFRYDRALVLRVMQVLLNRKSGNLREFRKMMGLIRKTDALRLRQSFRDTLLDYFKRFLEVRRRVPSAMPPASGTALSPLPSAKEFFASEQKLSPPPAPNFTKDTPDISFLMETPRMIGFSPEKIQAELYYRRTTELLSEFTIENPYEICAAGLLLERENDLLFRLNILTTAVLTCAARRLPWDCCPDGMTRLCCVDGAADASLRYLFQPSDSGCAVPDGRLLSEPQLFYLATGYLLPRDRVPSEELCAWFTEQGVPETRAYELTGAAMAFSVSEDTRTETDSGVWESAGAKVAKTQVLPPQPDDADTERLADLTRQLKSVRQSMHEREQRIRQLEEELRESAKRAEQDRMELIGLRDTLFRIRAGEIPELSVGQNPIHFPWQVTRRVLVFGGHDTWSKSIRPLLPGVRFFERESLPDLNAIRGADVVWIQPNALSHKFYYRIIDTARKENIVVRYFGFASARKCAEQLVEDELSQTEE